MRIATLVVLLLSNTTAGANPSIDPALESVASPHQIETLVWDATIIYKRSVQALQYVPCASAPGCIRSVKVSFEPELEGSNSYKFFYIDAYLKTWQQEGYLDPEESQVEIGDWHTSGEIHDEIQYRFRTRDGEKFVTILSDISYDDLQLILTAVDRHSYSIDLLPEHKQYVSIATQKVPGILQSIQVAGIDAVRRYREHGEYIYRLEVSANNEWWYYAIRNGQCVLVGYGYYSI